MLYFIGYTLSLLILKIFYRFKVYGAENIPKKGGFILASNHISNMDPFTVGVGFARKLNFMAKEELFKAPFLAWLFRSWAAFPVKRDTADLSAIKEAIKRVEAGGGLLLFPEGRRSVNGEIGIKAEAGIGFFAAKLNVPVIPAFVTGTEKALPRGAKFLRLSRISVYYGKAVQFDKNKPYQVIADEILQGIRLLAASST